MENIVEIERWLPIPYAPYYEVSQLGNVREVETGQLMIPETAHLVLNIPVARLVANVWHTHYQNKPVPLNPDAKLVFVDGNPENLNYRNLVFDELSQEDFAELDALNS
ncbi:hypothetical protein F1C16_05100 [Hymenobacter sp. NBH84]|uniref:NUMOD4 domain-containing protein n=1 Tax=Hymenobacter sp. NBH84 TaxID=2596915 RepID=UPI0016271827|nr:NUMOD4 domain-containing protein [Hymenobacter sp. NBH84]QNE38973.1 hypothetical protein F1C16_05100 [Hymenobacter sp. NBH84]